MSNLTFREKAEFENIFNMSSGYVLDLSNTGFSRFIREVIGIDIYQGPGYEDYCSKSNKLRQIWDNEPDALVGKLLDELLSYLEENSNIFKGKRDKETIIKLRLITHRLMENTSIVLPSLTEETLQTLITDINNALLRNTPTLVLDRLHTFSIKYLRNLCVEKEIPIENDRGISYPLHSLIGNLNNYYVKNNIFQSEFITTALKYSISVFEKFNDIRNNKSFAHDNEVLNTLEAEFVVKAMSNFLTFIDRIEKIQNKKSEISFVDDIPF
jgi:hypothetical protein